MDLQITFKADIINITNCTNFLGLNLDSTLSWKLHTEFQIKLIMLPNPVTEIHYLCEKLENNLFFLCTLHYDVWFNFLG